MKKILLVEDDNLVTTVYRNKFTLEGFEVEVAGDGDSGFEMVQSFRPDVVLLDLMLPKLPGLDLIKKIRAISDFKNLPVVVFTNSYLSSTIQEAWKAGATKCMTKSSCTPGQVVATVRSVVNSGSAATTSTPEPASQPAPTADPEDVDLWKNFVREFPNTLAGLRLNLQNLLKAENDNIRLQQLDKMYRRVHVLTGTAGLVGMARIAQLADALEALIKELFEKPKNVTASTLRTIASAIDCLALLFDQRASCSGENADAKIMVVDDDEISRRAVTHALEKAKLKSTSIEDPVKALNLLMQLKFDLVFLDVDMPNMNGYELCAKIRNLPAYKKTPVVFVTNLNDFEARANSTISGGNDFIAKPFLFIELTVKALIYVLRSQLHPAAK